MKILLDACVLYPTVMREVLIGMAQAGAFMPLWSDRLLEEWACAAARLDKGQEVVARGEIALLRARWPGAVIASDPDLETQLSLPDPDDVHVLAAAITGGADALMTLNTRDFPVHALNARGIDRLTPDGWLWSQWSHDPARIETVVERVRRQAEAISGRPQPMRALLKKARLPRLAKAVAQG